MSVEVTTDTELKQALEAAKRISKSKCPCGMPICKEAQQMARALLSLHERLGAADTDTERLDWCQERGSSFNAEGSYGKSGLIFGVFENEGKSTDQYWSADTFRAAIDLARGKR